MRTSENIDHTVYCKLILKWTRTRYSTRLKDPTSLRGSRWPLDQNVVRAEINIGWVRLSPPIMIIRQPNKQIKNEEKINICYNVLKGVNSSYYSPHNLKLRSSEVIIVYLLYPIFSNFTIWQGSRSRPQIVAKDQKYNIFQKLFNIYVIPLFFTKT